MVLYYVHGQTGVGLDGPAAGSQIYIRFSVNAEDEDACKYVDAPAQLLPEETLDDLALLGVEMGRNGDEEDDDQPEEEEEEVPPPKERNRLGSADNNNNAPKDGEEVSPPQRKLRCLVDLSSLWTHIVKRKLPVQTNEQQSPSISNEPAVPSDMNTNALDASNPIPNDTNDTSEGNEPIDEDNNAQVPPRNEVKTPTEELMGEKFKQKVLQEEEWEEVTEEVMDSFCILRAQVTLNACDYSKPASSLLLCHRFAPSILSPNCISVKNGGIIDIKGIGYFPTSILKLWAVLQLNGDGEWMESTLGEDEQVRAEHKIECDFVSVSLIQLVVPPLSDLVGDIQKIIDVKVSVEVQLSFFAEGNGNDDIIPLQSDPLSFYYFSPQPISVTPSICRRSGGRKLILSKASGEGFKGNSEMYFK